MNDSEIQHKLAKQNVFMKHKCSHNGHFYENVILTLTFVPKKLSFHMENSHKALIFHIYISWDKTLY